MQHYRCGVSRRRFLVLATTITILTNVALIAYYTVFLPQFYRRCPDLPDGVSLKGKSIFLSSILRNAMTVFPNWRFSVQRLFECVTELHGNLTVSIWSDSNTDETPVELAKLEQYLRDRGGLVDIVTNGEVPTVLHDVHRVNRLAWMRNRALLSPVADLGAAHAILFVNDVLWSDCARRQHLIHESCVISSLLPDLVSSPQDRRGCLAPAEHLPARPRLHPRSARHCRPRLRARLHVLACLLACLHVREWLD
jgi:hypothetical protein